MSDAFDPLTGPLPEEVPLPDAPLVRVLAQVRFPPIQAVRTEEFIAPFQESLRREYGILEERWERRFEVGPAGAREHDARTSAWKLFDTDRHWCVTLAPGFLALETRQYESRVDFVERLERVLVALREDVEPATVSRVGVRYIDRVPGLSREEVTTLVRPEALGLLGTELGARAALHVTDNLFDLEDGRCLRARWGMLPPGVTIDSTAIEPIEARSWMLDVDAFLEREQAMEVDAVSRQARGLAEASYRFFRWVVTDAFLRRRSDAAATGQRAGGRATAGGDSTDRERTTDAGGSWPRSMPRAPCGTSGGGASWVREPQQPEWRMVSSTNADGATAVDGDGGESPRAALSPQDAIAELRRLSGLTWGQLADVLDVSRRSLHLWASGRPMRPGNEERLRRVLGVTRTIDRGSSQENRQLLLSAGRENELVVDLLASEEYDHVVELLGEGPGSRRIEPQRLSPEELAKRRPLPIGDRAASSSETDHEDLSRPRRAKVRRPE